MQGKIEKVMQKVYNPQAQEVVKGLRKDAGITDNVVVKRQEITISRGFPSSNESAGEVSIVSQQNIWAEELRRADERVLKFK
jgi:hypothetical protein